MFMKANSGIQEKVPSVVVGGEWGQPKKKKVITVLNTSREVM